MCVGGGGSGKSHFWTSDTIAFRYNHSDDLYIQVRLIRSRAIIEDHLMEPEADNLLVSRSVGLRGNLCLSSMPFGSNTALYIIHTLALFHYV